MTKKDFKITAGRTYETKSGKKIRVMELIDKEYYQVYIYGDGIVDSFNKDGTPIYLPDNMTITNLWEDKRMKLYPVNIEITYASGTKEKKTIFKDYEKWDRDLRLMKEDGAIAEFNIETVQDRLNKKIGA